MTLSLLPLLVLAICGATMATQSTVNVALGRSLGLWTFAMVFTVVQLAATLPTFFSWGQPLRWATLAEVPTWQYVGGALGMPLLAAMAYALGRTGTFAGFVAVIFGQLLMGIVIDRFGLFGAAVQPVTLSKLLGLALIAGGIWLAR